MHFLLQHLPAEALLLRSLHRQSRCWSSMRLSFLMALCAMALMTPQSEILELLRSMQ